MKLFPSAATRVRPADILAALPRAGAGSATDDFVAAIAGRLGMAEGVPLTSLMRNTCLVMKAVQGEVILPRYCCPSFVHGIQAAGVSHRYCDIDPATLVISPALVEAALTPKSAAVLAPNLFGLSADMVALSDYCRARGLLLIEGADYSFGGTFAGRPSGSYGDFTLLNFQEGKALPIGGGMALRRLADKRLRDPSPFRSAAASKPLHPVSSLTALFRSLAYCLLIRPLPYGLFSRGVAALGIQKKRFSMEDTIRKTQSEFDFTTAEADLWRKISAYQSALGLRLLESIESQRLVRWHNALELESALTGSPRITLIPRHPRLDACNYIRYPILVPPQKRDGLCSELIHAGYEASPMYVEHGMHIAANEFPGAARVCAELLTLPCHPFMTADDMRRMAAIVRNFSN